MVVVLYWSSTKQIIKNQHWTVFIFWLSNNQVDTHKNKSKDGVCSSQDCVCRDSWTISAKKVEQVHTKARFQFNQKTIIEYFFVWRMKMQANDVV